MTLDLPVMVDVLVYDRNGVFKRLYSSGSSSLAGAEFTLGANGCGAFSLQFGDFVDILKADKVKIRLRDNATVFHMGVVRSVPIPGSTSQDFTYSGYGLNDYFSRINAGHLSFAGQSLTAVVTWLVDYVIAPNSVITKDPAKISLPPFTIGSLDMNYPPVRDALEALKRIADSSGTEHNYGVDEEGEFFFLPRDPATVATLVVGKDGPSGIDSYEPVDEQGQRTRVYVLRRDGSYFATLNGSAGADIYQEKLTGPDLGDDDLTLWATGYLYGMQRELRSAEVEWPLDPADALPMLAADGFVRVISNRPPAEGVTQGTHNWGDGNWGDGVWGGDASAGYNLDDLLALKEITYSVSESGVSRTLSLGTVPPRMEAVVAGAYRKIAGLELTLGV